MRKKIVFIFAQRTKSYDSIRNGLILFGPYIVLACS